MSNQLKLAIIGPGRSGKDTVARMLAQYTTLRYCLSTSEMAKDFAFGYMRDRGHRYADVDACWQDRGNYRELWAALIDEYNADDHCRLYREHFRIQDILTGVRKQREFLACRMEGLFDLAIYVHKVDTAKDVSLTVHPEMCDIVIGNNRTEFDLRAKVYRLSKAMGVWNGTNP